MQKSKRVIWICLSLNDHAGCCHSHVHMYCMSIKSLKKGERRKEEKNVVQKKKKKTSLMIHHHNHDCKQVGATS